MGELISPPVAALFCFFTALVFSLYGTPVAARAAKTLRHRGQAGWCFEKHREPIPYLGGLAVFVSFFLTMALVFDFDQRVLGLLLAGTILVLLGLIDDFGVLGVWPKFLGQGIATMVLIKSGIAIHIGVFPSWLNLLLTVIWIIGMTNALNIIDIMDGLAAGTAVIALAFLMVVSFLNGQVSIVLMIATLLGSLVGFLRFNHFPARIFLGDTGSLFLGMMLGSFAMIGKYDRINPIGYLTPLLFLAIPIFDTLYVMILRSMKGKNPFQGSPDHFAIRLKRLGLSSLAVVRLSWIVAIVIGGLGLMNLTLGRSASLTMVSSVALFLVLAGVALSRVNMEVSTRTENRAAPMDEVAVQQAGHGGRGR